MRNSYVPSSTLTHAIDLFLLRTFEFRELEAASWPQFYCERPSLFSEFLDDNKSLVCPGEMSVDGRNNLKLCFYVPQEICKNNI
ncbi:unnamed protein product [Rhizophagus irregularis]|nr:unnamed protein product [Rhizophagus irregularis]